MIGFHLQPMGVTGYLPPMSKVSARWGIANTMATQQAVRLDFDMRGGRTPKPQPGAPRDRPWRKSAAAVAAERQEVTDRHSNLATHHRSG